MDVPRSVQVIKVFLVVMACLRPDFTYCEQVAATEITKAADPMYWCLLNRPWVSSMWQLRLNDGWTTFTRCQLVNTGKNGRLG